MSELTVDVRDGEQVSTDALLAWMSGTVAELVPAGAALVVRQFPAGFSNLTYLVTAQSEHGRRAWVLRRPPHGAVSGNAHNMAREYGVLRALHPLGLPVPAPLAYCDDRTVIGAPFFLMDHVDGVILRGAPPAALTADAAALPARMRALSRTVVGTLVQLHAVPLSAPLAALGNAEGYVQRQVAGWTKRWHAARTSEVPAMDAVATWLEAHRPAERGATLVHNDFKLDNLVLSDDFTQVQAILDWEMATVGDPLMDLGTSLAYWVQADDAPVFRTLGLGITALPGAFTRAEFVRAYAERSGRDVTDAPYYYAFGLFKVAVIAQQIYARHQQGLTHDKRFAALGDVVLALSNAALITATTGVV